ncbi:hypothetical protein Droror1_Dr00026993 [Drosera rotundifolia]
MVSEISSHNSVLEEELKKDSELSAEHEGQASATHKRSLELEDLLHSSHSKFEGADKWVAELESLREAEKGKVQELEEQINAQRKNERSRRSISGKRQRRRRKRKILNGAFMSAVDQPQAQVLAQEIPGVLPLQLTHGIMNRSTDDREPSIVSNISDDDKPFPTWFEGAQSL